MSWVGGVIGGIGSILGAGSSRASASRNRVTQLGYLTHGIRARVNDAKKAGLHPLYALGAQIPAYSPVQDASGEFLAEAGQSIGRAIDARKTRVQLEADELGLAVLRSQIRENDARALFYESEAARNRQNPVNAAPVMGKGDFMDGAVGAVEFKPDPVISQNRGDPSVTAGEHPGLTEYTVTPWGLKMRLPYSQEGPGETWGELSWYDKLALIKHNMNIYGNDWGQRFWNEFVLGKPPGSRGKTVPQRGAAGEW